MTLTLDGVMESKRVHKSNNEAKRSKAVLLDKKTKILDKLCGGMWAEAARLTLG
jgi:hypothetical protein